GAAEGGPAGEGVDPADQVVGLGQLLGEVVEEGVEVGQAVAADAEEAGLDLLEAQLDARDDAQEAEAADDRVEDVGVLGARAGQGLAGGRDEVELEDVLPEVAGA